LKYINDFKIDKENGMHFYFLLELSFNLNFTSETAGSIFRHKAQPG
jgi:hypothetical protein